MGHKYRFTKDYFILLHKIIQYNIIMSNTPIYKPCNVMMYYYLTDIQYMHIKLRRNILINFIINNQKYDVTLCELA